MADHDRPQWSPFHVDPTFAPTLAATLALESAAPRQACPSGCHWVPMSAALHADHAQVCPRARIACPLGCGFECERDELWHRHLSRGRCPNYTVYCSSFECERAEEKNGTWRKRGAEGGVQEESAMIKITDENRAHSLERLAGCDLQGASHRTERADHSHYEEVRRQLERERFFIDSQTITAIDGSSSSSSSSARGTAGIRLDSCPTCLQRLCVSLDPSFTSAEPLECPPQPIPLNRGSYEPVYGQYGRQRRVGVAAPGEYYGAYRPSDYPAQTTLILQRLAYTWQISALVLSQQQAREHVLECERRSDGSGIFSFQPRPDDIVISPYKAPPKQNKPQCALKTPNHPLFMPPHPPATIAAPTTAAAASSSSSSDASAPESEAAPPPGTVFLRYSFSMVLVQTFLFQLGLRLLRSSSSSFTRERRQDAEQEAAPALFRQGASLSDLMLMYEPCNAVEYRLRADVRPLYNEQPRTLDVDGLVAVLAPLQRPLVAPLLDPWLIPDLANMCLDYF